MTGKTEIMAEKTDSKTRRKKAKGGKKKAPAQKERAPEVEVLDAPGPEPGASKDKGGDKSAEPVQPEVQEAQPDETSLVYVTPLQRYLAEIRRLPLLTREEEHELAVRFQDQGDREAAYRMVTSNLRLVVKIALEFQRTFINVMDLIQEGNIGLMQAVAKFDPYRGVKLSSYASWWIKAYILRYILNNWRLVKIGTTQAQRKLFYNLQKEKEKLERQGFTAQPNLLAERLDVTPEEVVEMEQRLSKKEVSLEMPIRDDSGSTVSDLIASTEVPTDELLGEAESLQMVHEYIEEFAQTLSEKDLFIFRHRMLAEEPLTLQEIGDEFGITRERVRQLESRIMGRLKQFLQEHGIDGA